MSKLLNRVLFFGIILPIAYLPTKVLYGISNVFYYLLLYILKYRIPIVEQNLKNSFPLKTDHEQKALRNQFYRYLSDTFIEGILNLRLSRKEVMKRYKCKNPELVNQFYKQGKSVILLSSHYNNWEYMITSLEMQFEHHGIGVGKALSNKEFGQLLTQYRTRFGTEVIEADRIREQMQQYFDSQKACTYMMLSDQSPGNRNKCYWTTFLHQDTGFIFGGEHFAKKYDFPVFFYYAKRIKRGFYEIEVKLIEEHPLQSQHGEITEKYVQLFEQLITEEPAYWLWSHKRWKHRKPENL